jgi:hypothetical protein
MKSKPGPQSVSNLLPEDPVSLLWPRQMSIRTAARYLDVTPWAIEQLFRSGEIVAYKRGAGPKAAWAADRKELDKYVERKNAQALLGEFVANVKLKVA